MRLRDQSVQAFPADGADRAVTNRVPLRFRQLQRRFEFR
ncbi:MAG: hypothetical protein JWM63_4505 [Gammaproteobacteria bacterium]|jgi:hypothetical protein|nr:hypothetical protein [Gammaproteobacteria bacterium]